MLRFANSWAATVYQANEDHRDKGRELLVGNGTRVSLLCLEVTVVHGSEEDIVNLWPPRYLSFSLYTC